MKKPSINTLGAIGCGVIVVAILLYIGYQFSQKPKEDTLYEYVAADFDMQIVEDPALLPASGNLSLTIARNDEGLDIRLFDNEGKQFSYKWETNRPASDELTALDRLLSNDPRNTPPDTSSVTGKDRAERLEIWEEEKAAWIHDVRDRAISLAGHTIPKESYKPWDPEVVKSFASIPVQQGGRVMPMETFAHFNLLTIQGKRTARFQAEGVDYGIKPVEWLMDCLYRPELARQYPVFVIDDPAAVEDFGMKAHASRSDRYSFTEIDRHRLQLMRKAKIYSEIETNKITAKERMVRDLATNFRTYEAFLKYMEFGRVPQGNGPLTEFVKGLDEQLQKFQKDDEAEGEKKEVSVIDVLISARLRGDDSLRASLAPFFSKVSDSFFSSQVISMFPPDNPNDEHWGSPAKLMFDFIQKNRDADPRAMEKVEWLQETVLAHDAGDDAAFKTAVASLNEKVANLADKRGEVDTIGLEGVYNKGDFFYYGLVFFVLAFILMSLTWLAPESGAARILRRATFWLCMIPCALVVIGITIRCIIMARPPIGTLYETILFITGTGAIVALIVYYVNKSSNILTLATAIGSIGLFVAIGFEASGVKGDTMKPLGAVLRTNFWLGTHVVIINIGYAAGLLAAGISHFFLLGKVFKIRSGDATYYRNLTRMTYGVIAFCLLFSLVGTVLGGIWANDSWGRFWGWDPKENGALMIVLWCLIALHLRLGGYIKELGMHVFSITLGGVVAFSWWGVNLFNVGLHSYGFVDGVGTGLWYFGLSQGLVLVAGVIAFYLEKNSLASSSASAQGGGPDVPTSGGDKSGAAGKQRTGAKKPPAVPAS